MKRRSPPPFRIQQMPWAPSAGHPFNPQLAPISPKSHEPSLSSRKKKAPSSPGSEAEHWESRTSAPHPPLLQGPALTSPSTARLLGLSSSKNSPSHGDRSPCALTTQPHSLKRSRKGARNLSAFTAPTPLTVIAASTVVGRIRARASRVLLENTP